MFIKHNGLNIVIGMVGRGTEDSVYTWVIGVWLFYKYLLPEINNQMAGHM